MARELTFSSNKFSYNKATDTFVAEASELQIYDGRPFYIRSERTGDTRLFLINRREFTQDADQEFVAWHGFCPGGGHKVTIFND